MREGSSTRRRTRGGADRGEPPPRDDRPEPDADPESVARSICLAQLEHAPRTRAELAAVLAKRGVPDDDRAARATAG